MALERNCRYRANLRFSNKVKFLFFNELIFIQKYFEGDLFIYRIANAVNKK